MSSTAGVLRANQINTRSVLVGMLTAKQTKNLKPGSVSGYKPESDRSVEVRRRSAKRLVRVDRQVAPIPTIINKRNKERRHVSGFGQFPAISRSPLPRLSLKAGAHRPLARLTRRWRPCLSCRRPAPLPPWRGWPPGWHGSHGTDAWHGSSGVNDVVLATPVCEPRGVRIDPPQRRRPCNQGGCRRHTATTKKITHEATRSATLNRT